MRMITALASSLLILLSVPARAAELEAGTKESGFVDRAGASKDQLIVTATRRPVSALDVSACVSVITGDDAERASAFNGAEEIVQLQTGIEAALANGAQVAFQIRGIGAVDHQALTPTAASVYSDGVFLATNVQTSSLLYDLSRVEILKGPQGTLYGRNASSGAINFITARAGDDAPSYIRASYGRYDRVDITAAVSSHLTERMSARLAGRYLSEGPVLENVQSDPAISTGPAAAAGERDEFGLRASVLFEASGNASMHVRGHYEKDNGVNPTPVNDSLSLQKHQISSEGDGVQDTDNTFYGASIEATATLGRWSLFSQTALEGYDQRYGFDFDGTPAPFANPDLNANLRYDRDFLQLSQESRAQAAVGPADILVGIMATAEEFAQDYLIWCGQLDPITAIGTCPYVGAAGRVGPTPSSPGTAMSLLTHIEQDRSTFAIFTHNDIALNEKLTLTLGGRFTYENIKGEGFGVHIFDDGVRAFNNRDGAGAAMGDNSIREHRFSGNAALRYALSRNVMIYGAFANGFKSGGFNGEVQNNATHFQDEGLFATETVNAWELGVKTKKQNALSFNAAFFFQDYDAPQARIFVDFPLPDGGRITSNSLSNLDAAVAYGAEADVVWTPRSGLNLRAGLTFLETEIRQATDGAGNAMLFDGNPLPFAPRVSATLGGSYTRSVVEGVTARISANGKFRSAFYLDAEGLDARRQGAYATLDASLEFGFDANNVEIQFWGRNLTDTDYAVSGFGFIGYNTFRSSPRSYGVAIRYEF